MGVKWALVWAWWVMGVVSLPCRAHRTQEDPRLNLRVLDVAHLRQEESEEPTAAAAGVGAEGGLSQHLALELHGGEDRARSLAHTYSLHYVRQVFTHPPVYHLHQPDEGEEDAITTNSSSDSSSWRRQRRRAESLYRLVRLLAQEPGVRWVKQQKSFVRDKRRVVQRPRQYDQQQRQGRPLGTRSSDGRGTYTYHTAPANIVNLRSIVDELFRRHSEVGGREETTYRSRREDISEDEENLMMKGRQATVKEGVISDHMDRTLVRIPLSRTTGSSVDQLLREYTRGRNVDKMNLYSLRYIIPPDTNRRTRRTRNKEGEKNLSNGTPRSAATAENNITKSTDHTVGRTPEFNDPFYKDQWYLHNTGQLGGRGHDLNVTWAWLRGFTGRGVVLSILDDGIQTTNADIADHYVANISYSLVRDGQPVDDPSPRLDPNFSNSHGTYCAGVVAAVPNNSVCGVGVAYEARVGGVRIVDGTVTDVQEATALSRYIDKVDVFSASWGPTDNGKKAEGPGKLARKAFLEGVTKGRGGKGVVYVWASGNGGIMGDNCNLDGYTSSIYTLSVSALTDDGTSTFYEEPCASTLGAVYVGGEHSYQDASERHARNLKNRAVVVPELDGHCSSSFQGTSAAAPLMAGVVALVLHANPNLTWRDMQHLVVETATPTDEALREDGWQTNAYGKKFHLMQGFGAVDAGKMVELALKWKNVKPQKNFTLPMFSGYKTFHPYEWLNRTHHLDLPDVPSSTIMTAVEHVIATISLSHPKRSKLTIFIVSPSGTTSQVLTHRPLDANTGGFRSWKFMSVHFWGECPNGTWNVAIKDSSGKKGYLKKVELTVYGL